MQVHVRDNNVDQALRALKKKLQREGVFREMKLRRDFEKPSARRKRERAEAVRARRQVWERRLFEAHAREALAFYGREARFADQPFWRARSGRLASV